VPAYITCHREYYCSQVGAASFNVWAERHPEELAVVMDK
jgi:hypothetical protein